MLHALKLMKKKNETVSLQSMFNMKLFEGPKALLDKVKFLKFYNDDFRLSWDYAILYGF